MINAEYMRELFSKNPPKIEMILSYLSYRLRRLTGDYLDACKLIYDISDAENSGNISDELKKKAEEFEIKIYG